MTINNTTHREVDTSSTAALAVVDKIDGFARKLYRRARNAGPDFEDIAPVVRDLYSVLKHLRVEAEDSESLLNSDKSGVHLRQLTPIVEDTQFTLRQLDNVLENYFNCGANGMNDGDKGWTMLDTMSPKKVGLIRSKLDREKLRIDMFLDTIQTHNPSKSRQMVSMASPSTGSESSPRLPAYPILPDSSEEFLGISDIDNEKYFPSTNMERLGYVDYPVQNTTQPIRSAGSSHDRLPSDEPSKPASGSTALVSTREVMGSRDVSNLSNAVESWQLNPNPLPKHWSTAPSDSRAKASDMSLAAPVQEPVNQKYARLLWPDGRGREIPMNATWTRIPRRLVSPEVVGREGLRFEAKPDYVAILGELKKDEVSDLAKKSSKVRRERQRIAANAISASMHSRHGRRDHRSTDRSHPDECRNWDFTEGRQVLNGGPVRAIDPHHHRRANSSASSIGEIWDSTDDESPAEYTWSRPATSRYSSSYPPRSRLSPSSHYRSASPRSGASNGAASTSHDDDEKGPGAYPFIVPPPAKDGDGSGKTSPSATVKPKPILKNKNDDPHVRFDPEPQVFDESSKSAPQSVSRRDKEKETHESGYRERDRDKSLDRSEHEKKYRPDDYIIRERHRDRSHRDHDREHRHGSRSRSDKRYYVTSGRHDDRDYYQHRQRSRECRDRDRDRGRNRSKDADRGTHKKSRSDPYRSSGISGLMNILTEAAASL